MASVAIIDYGRGNVRSVKNAVEHCGTDAVVTADAHVLNDASHIILPGVGAFGDAIAALKAQGLPDILRDQVIAKGKPFLGICLGMQLLADRSDEHGAHDGLGWIAGDVARLDPGPDALKIPHMGWNDVTLTAAHPLFTRLKPDQLTFYFVHSYHFRTADNAHQLARCAYGTPFTAAVAKDNILGVQFHPEKSQDSGVALLENLVRWNP